MYQSTPILTVVVHVCNRADWWEKKPWWRCTCQQQCKTTKTSRYNESNLLINLSSFGAKLCAFVSRLLSVLTSEQWDCFPKTNLEKKNGQNWRQIFRVREYYLGWRFQIFISFGWLYQMHVRKKTFWMIISGKYWSGKISHVSWETDAHIKYTQGLWRVSDAFIQSKNRVG